MGTFSARSVQLRARKLSTVQRLRRFLSNGAVQVCEWYAPTTQALLLAGGSGGQVRLIMDSTKVNGGQRLIMVSVGYRRRRVPLAWTWARGARGHCTTQVQVKLLRYVQGLLPLGVQVSVVGDCEYGNSLFIEYMDHWGLAYALRQPGDHLVMSKGDGQWQRIENLPLTISETQWWGRVVLTRASAYPVNLILYWRHSEKAARYFTTSCLTLQSTLALYRRRMWIEEMFGDMKKHGFDHEASHLRHFLRLSRLTLVVCLLYVWLIALGDYVLTHALSTEVDRPDCRDLSIFRLGWDFLERRLACCDPIPPVLIPNFCSVYGR
ncbi:MAG: hypothetical protein BroJett018_27670 [Chloroflexota bacterium]|nr:hypothetical protein [Chloroflexota bacterium]GIK64973.1 MAG: hypothetical protein BroJett018_27670 [Chloroflexota bacterium]